MQSVKSILTCPVWLRLHDRIEASPGQAERLRRILLKSCKILAKKYLYVKNSKIYCFEHNFEEWQDLITQISPIPLFAALLIDTYPTQNNVHDSSPYKVFPERLLSDWLQWSSLPSCFNSELFAPSNMNLHINDEHAHFTGMMQADMAWQRCLSDTPTICRNLTQRRTLPEAYLLEDIKNVWDICYKLHFARWLQESLSLLVADEHLLQPCLLIERDYRGHLKWETWRRLCQSDQSCRTWFETYYARRMNHPELGMPFFLEGEGAAHPLSQCEHYSPFWPGSLDTHAKYLVNEGVLWLRGFQSSNPLVPYMLHCYSLLCAQFRRIAVHQPDMSGFKRFQDLTRTGLTRTHSLLQQQFMQLYDMEGKRFNNLDCRFTPQNNKERNVEAYKKYSAAIYGKEPVLWGFRRLQPLDRLPFYRIQLRPHFHKEEDAFVPTDSHHLAITPVSCRHAKLRRKVAKQAGSLLTLKESYPSWLLYGKDAAGNEEFCPPEVFAPAFRLLTKYAGAGSIFSHTTYHVGEAFPDVTSGLRSVAEALRFLELKPEDRIGHGTALGIDPTWWRGGRPHVTLQQGALLDNYVWIWGLWEELSTRLREGTLTESMGVNLGADHLRRTFLTKDVENLLLGKIFYLFRCIYVDIYNDYLMEVKNIASLLYRAWEMRRLDPLCLNESIKSHMTQWEQDEISLINNASKDSEAFKLFTAYHTNYNVRKNYCKYIEYDIRYIIDEIIYIIQDYLIWKMNENNVKIEVIPTVNKRIVGYKNYSDHPAIRWLGTHAQDLRPSPSIVIGSDNPGLLSTSIFNEYIHLYIALKKNMEGYVPSGLF